MTAIDSEKYSKILNKNISLDLYFLLSELKQGNGVLNHKKVDGYLLLAEKQNYISPEGKLTDKAFELLAYINDDKVFLQEVEKKSQSFNSYCQSLFTKLENKVIELGQKKTYKNPSGERLLPSNVKELSDRIRDFQKKYNYYDLNRIEEEVIKYVEKCIKKRNQYQRSLYYFCFKEKFPSELLKALTDNEVEKETSDSNNETSVEGVYIL